MQAGDVGCGDVQGGGMRGKHPLWARIMRGTSEKSSATPCIFLQSEYRKKLQKNFRKNLEKYFLGFSQGSALLCGTLP